MQNIKSESVDLKDPPFLDHEIALESLSYEQERWRVRVENNQLLQQKLRTQSNLAEIELERARTELALKKNECMTLGLSV